MKVFAKRAASFNCLDVAVLNAGIATENFEVLEDNESTMTVNMISSTLLGLLFLPELRSSAKKWGFEPTFTFVDSWVHAYTSFPERKMANSIETPNNRETAVMLDRYQVSKLLRLFAVRESVEQTANKTPSIIVNTLEPGLCHTDLTRHAEGITAAFTGLMRYLLGWTAEEISQKPVLAATAGPESQGVMMSCGRIKRQATSRKTW